MKEGIKKRHGHRVVMITASIKDGKVQGRNPSVSEMIVADRANDRIGNLEEEIVRAKANLSTAFSKCLHKFMLVGEGNVLNECYVCGVMVPEKGVLVEHQDSN